MQDRMDLSFCDPSWGDFVYGPLTPHTQWPGRRGGQTFFHWGGDIVPGMREQPDWETVQMGKRGVSPEALATIGERIRWARKQKEWTQEGLAHHAKVSIQSVRYWEAGGHKPSVVARKKLQDALGVSYSFLLYGGKP